MRISDWSSDVCSSDLLGWPAKALDAARVILEAHGDRVNAAHARYLELRRLLLIGRLDEAERLLAALDPAPFPPASRAARSEEHTSELQSLMRISYAVFCLKKKNTQITARKTYD